MQIKNSFSINTIFFVLTIIGLSLIPFISVQLHPSIEGDSLFVSCSWSDVSAEVVEKEVTSVLEGVLSSIKGVEEINSSSLKGYCQISLKLKKGIDVDAIRFEAGSILRHITTKLPEGTSRPRVSAQGKNEGDKKLLMSYTLNGEGSSLALQKYAEDHIVPTLSMLDDVVQVSVSGATPLEWELSYNTEELNRLNLTANNLRQAISIHLERDELGAASFTEAKDSTYLFLSLFGQPGDSLNWNRIPVTNHNGRMLYLTDLAEVKLKEQQARSFFRINGLNTIYLSIYTGKGTNQVKVGRVVRKELEHLKKNFPKNFSLLLSMDNSEKLREETGKILFRSGLALVILLLFVLLVSRQWQYLTVIGLGLFANLAIAIVFFYLFQIEIHIYSLAGITVSLGIIIDNAIVTADHIRQHKNNRVFLAILAATLTSMGALSIIFFLNDYQRINLVDFASVLLVNLGVSLFISLFFIPALMDKIPLKVNRGRKTIRRKRRVVKLTHTYNRFIDFSYRFKWLYILGFIWAFGLPIFMIPDHLGDARYSDEELTSFQTNYNKILGNNVFVSKVKPWLNKIVGGSLYYFSSYVAEHPNIDNRRTELTVNVTMPDGASVKQMNKVFIELENYLAGFKEIDRFISSLSKNTGSIQISFKKEFENTAFPYRMKNLLIEKAVETGSADFVIHGVGRGFSNELYQGEGNNTILMSGYNYDELMSHARFLKKELLSHNRIKEVFISTGRRASRKPKYEFVADINLPKLGCNSSSIGNLYGQLKKLTYGEMRAGEIPCGNDYLPVVLRPVEKQENRIWDLMNHPINGQSGQAMRLKDVATVKKARVSNGIAKRNQEYQVRVNFDFIGPYQLAKRVIDQKIEMINEYLPLGFSAQKSKRFYYWNHKEKKQYMLLFLVIVIIYFICAILLESLWQPLAVIATIPLSFIGVFLTFTLFKYPFDQGGYASMVLLCGLTVNSALYIINDYNNSRRQKSAGLKTRYYLKAFNHKITPILLTTLSTALGLIPFLISGREEGFWFSLAVGAIGGLVFSLVAIVIALPLFMKLKLKK